MGPDRARRHIERESAAFNRAAPDALERTVPSCPEWTGLDLAAHVGSLYRWYAHLLTEYPTERPHRDETAPAPTEVPAWLNGGRRDLLDVLPTADPNATMWTLAGAGKAAFWWRRAANEIAMHRWDIEASTGEPGPLDGGLAADGIAELFEFFLVARRSSTAAHRDAVMSIETVEPATAWVVRFDGSGVHAAVGSGNADLSMRGPAGPLLLALWGRLPLSAVDCDGDMGVFDLWRGAVRF